MYVLRHKILPYFLTWEGPEESFEELKSQINMEMKENGIDGFTVKFISGNTYVSENDEPKKSRVIKPADRKRKGPRVGEKVKKPMSRKSPIKKSGGEDLGKLRTRKVVNKKTKPKEPITKASKLDTAVQPQGERKNA